MHEMSLALEICRVAEEHVGRERLADVVTVGLDVGDDTGVEVDNLVFCLEALLGHPPFGRARAKINRETGDVFRITYLEVDDGNPDD